MCNIDVIVSPLEDPALIGFWIFLAVVVLLVACICVLTVVLIRQIIRNKKIKKENREQNEHE